MSVARKVVVDDSDAHLSYTGGWIQEQPGSYDHYGNFGSTYLSTTHSTSSGGNVTFPFNGTSIQVFGTTAVSGKPTWDCYVDGKKFAHKDAFFAAENNWPLCEVDLIADGQHELTIDVTSTNGTFAFDWLNYTPSLDASLATAVVQIDHTDSALNYSSTGWSESYALLTRDGTTSGKSLSWIGYIPVEMGKAPANGTYTIDGGLPTPFKLSGLDSSATDSVYHQTFFTTQDLSQGSHTILVTYNGGSKQTPLTMDYLLITNSSETTSETTSASPEPHPTVAATAGPIVPVGPIVGAVVAAIALVTAVIAFFLVRKRKRNRRRNARPKPYDLTEPETFDPFQHSIAPFTEPYIPSPMEEIHPTQSRSSLGLHHYSSSASTSEVSLGYMTTDSHNVSSTALFIPGYSKSSMAMSKQQEASLDAHDSLKPIRVH
ncbi:hypothetical protein H0H87_008235 [Tephrocybe sp. NHM501043]|nr:hypothetical protein H0H87_008235 [Tephrocybe sp. NHM501043]